MVVSFCKDEGRRWRNQSLLTVMRDHFYLIFDRSQTDAVPSAVLVKTKRLTCCRNSSMLLQSVKVGAVDPAGKAGRPGGDPLGGGIGQCGPGRLVHADGAVRSRNRT